MKLRLLEFPSKMFTVTDKNRLSCDASDMMNRQFQQIYDDVADLGFAVRSDKTGAVVIYSLIETLKKDGEVVAWQFTPITESIRKHPACRHTVVTVFND